MTSEPKQRRQATAAEAKALAHPLRLRILRLCTEHALTNAQLAEGLGRDPGTVLYHVRLLAREGFIAEEPVRTGTRGALEKPYRATGKSWSVSMNLAVDSVSFASLEAFREELLEAGPASLVDSSRFVLHLTEEEQREFGARMLAVIDEWVESDKARTEDPSPERAAYGSLWMLHRLAD